MGYMEVTKNGTKTRFDFSAHLASHCVKQLPYPFHLVVHLVKLNVKRYQLSETLLSACETFTFKGYYNVITFKVIKVYIYMVQSKKSESDYPTEKQCRCLFLPVTFLKYFYSNKTRSFR